MSENVSLHTEIQLKLAKLGRAVGCDVWVPSRDRDKQFMGEKLLAYSLQTLPSLGFASEVRSIIENIDTIWLQENRVEAAFEIEHSTKIYSGEQKTVELGRFLFGKSVLDFGEPAPRLPLRDDRELRRRILAMTSSHSKQLGIGKSTLHYLRKKAQNEESFIVYETTRSKIERHREAIKP
jgi:hypothetical protein